MARARYDAARRRHGVQPAHTTALEGTGGSADIGDVAVVEDDGTVLAPTNVFDLAGRAFRFSPAGARGYRVTSSRAVFDASGADEVLLSDDDSLEVHLDWRFPFYGIEYDAVFVNSDGNITLTGADEGAEARDLGRFLAQPPRIAALFTDLDPSAAGSIRIRSFEDALQVAWDGVAAPGSSKTNSFSIRLFKNGDIEFVYGEQVGVVDAVVGLSPALRDETVSAVDYRDLPESGFLTGSIVEVFASRPGISESALARLFLNTHRDDFDHVIVFLGFDHNLDNGYAYEINVKNEVEGIGLSKTDNTPLFGSDGRLRSFVMMGSLDGPGRYPSDPRLVFLGTNSTITIMAHEVGHRWLAFAGFRDGDVDSGAMLGRQAAHWSFFLDSDASVMGGNDIEDRGAGSGKERFITRSATRTYSRLDQYFMGLVSPEEVPATFLVEDPTANRSPGSAPATGISFGGTRKELTIGQVITATGRRVPSAVRSPKVLRQAFVLLVRQGRPAVPEQIAKVQKIRNEWVAFVREQTEGRAWVVTDLAATPETTARTLYFPRFREDQSRYTGVALVNWGVQPADLLFSALSDDGATIAESGTVRNPLMVTLAPHSQVTLPVSQLHGLGADGPRKGWMRAQSTSSTVAADFVEGDLDRDLIGGSTASDSISPDLYFTARPVSPGDDPSFVNTIDVVNPAGDSVELEFRLHDAAGECRAVAHRALPARGRLSESVHSLFPDFPSGAAAGYIRLHATAGVFGYQSVDNGSVMERLAGRPAPAATRLHAPQFASGLFGTTRFVSELTLINTAEVDRLLRLQLRGDDGSLIGAAAGSTVTVLPARAVLRARAEALFGLPDAALARTGVAGSLTITADGPGMLGEVRCGDPAGRVFGAALPLETAPARDLIVPQVLQGAVEARHYFTGLALQNPTSATAEVTVEVYSASGAPAGTGRLTLGPLARVSRTLPELVPGLTQPVCGYVRISSEGAPLAACALLGGQGLEFLYPVAPQTIPEPQPSSPGN